MKKQASLFILGVILCLGFFSFWANFIGEPSNNANLSAPIEVAEVSHDSIIHKSANMTPATNRKDPEPATLVLVGVGLVGFVTMRLSRERE